MPAAPVAPLKRNRREHRKGRRVITDRLGHLGAEMFRHRHHLCFTGFEVLEDLLHGDYREISRSRTRRNCSALGLVVTVISSRPMFWAVTLS
jgi:hypothetical protein